MPGKRTGLRDVQRSCGCPIPGSVRGQAGQGRWELSLPWQRGGWMGFGVLPTRTTPQSHAQDVSFLCSLGSSTPQCREELHPPKKRGKTAPPRQDELPVPGVLGCDSAPQNLSPGVKIQDDSALVPDFTGITGWPWHTSHTWGQPRASGHVSPASRGQEQRSRRRFLLIPALPPGAGSGLSLHPGLQTRRGHGLGARFPSKMHRDGQRLQESPSPSSAPLQESQR